MLSPRYRLQFFFLPEATFQIPPWNHADSTSVKTMPMSEKAARPRGERRRGKFKGESIAIIFGTLRGKFGNLCEHVYCVYIYIHVYI